MTTWESLCELDARRLNRDEEAAHEEARALLFALATEHAEDRIWAVSHGDPDELRAVVYAASRERHQHRDRRGGGSLAGRSRVFARYVVELDDEEADPELCREHYDDVLERGQFVTSRVAQSGRFRIRTLKSVSDDDLRCAALAAAVAEEESWSL